MRHIIIYEILILNVVQETELQSVIQIQKSQNSILKIILLNASFTDIYHMVFKQCLMNHKQFLHMHL